MSFLEELKKRHVFKVGAAYAIVGWLLVQAADVFVPALHLPDWVITLVAGLVLVGFPVALLLAWAYEVTPGGIVTTEEAQAMSVAPAAGQRLNYIIMAVVVLAVVFLIIDRFLLDSRPSRPAVSHTVVGDSLPAIAAAVVLPESAPLGVGTADIGFDSPSIALSPDSRWLVYVSMDEETSRLYRHRLDGFSEPEAIPGTEDAIHPFFSPDGKYIGFLTNERVKRVPVDGDDVKTIASSKSPVRAQWLVNDVIYFVDNQGNSLRRVDVRTGTVETLAEQMPLFFSGVLPGGQFALANQRNFSISGDYAEIQHVNLATGEFKPIGIAGFDARLLPTGELMFGRNGNLFVVGFDKEAGRVTGEPQRVLRGVAMDSTFHQVQVALSGSGTLAFIPGTDRAVGRVIAVDMDGNERPLPLEPKRYGVLDLDHGDARIALQVADVKDFVEVFDLAKRTGRKLSGSTGYGWPVFAVDGRIVMTENTEGTVDTRIKVVPTDGSEPRIVMDSKVLEGNVSDWSPDGRQLVLSDWQNQQMGLYPSSGEGKLEMIASQSIEWGGTMSPDGQWLAYSSDETGRFEIWVRPLSERGQRRQVTVNGGIESVWCPCGKIFFRRGDEFWFVTVETEPELAIGPEELAFTVVDFLDTPGRSYDVSSDGQTLYTLKRSEPANVGRINVISNWIDQLPQAISASSQ